MALTIEDGSRVTNADSYVTEAELSSYATARGITISGDTEELLIKAMDFLEGLNFKGIQVRHDQALQWPRTGVYVDSYLVDTDEIPNELKIAQKEIALAIDRNLDPLEDFDRVYKSATVGAVSVEYSDSSPARKIALKAFHRLAKLLQGGGIGGNNFVVG